MNWMNGRIIIGKFFLKIPSRDRTFVSMNDSKLNIRNQSVNELMNASDGRNWIATDELKNEAVSKLMNRTIFLKDNNEWLNKLNYSINKSWNTSNKSNILIPSIFQSLNRNFPNFFPFSKPFRRSKPKKVAVNKTIKLT